MSIINPPNPPLVDNTGRVTPPWYRFFVSLQKDTSDVALSVDDAALLTGNVQAQPDAISGGSDAAYLAYASAQVAEAVDSLTPPYVERINVDATTGLVEQTGFDTFTKRAIGVASATDVLTRGDGDARYAAAGVLFLNIRTVTTSPAISILDYTILADATSGAITVNLPSVATSANRILVIKKIDSSINTVTIDGNASETIDGAATQVIITQYNSLTIQCDGTAWWII